MSPPQPPRPPLSSFHSNFFSSLKQVEKRLKLDSTIPSSSQQSSSPPIPPPPPQWQPQPQPQSDSIYTASQSLGSVIHLNFDQPTTTNSSTLQDSEPPDEFLSNNSLDFPPTYPDPPQSNIPKHLRTINCVVNTGIDDIDMLMELLDLSGSGKEEPGRICLGLNCNADGRNSSSSSGDCGCGHDGFYSKIVGAKGPKCGKELERLNGWIKHFLDRGSNGNERRESFRLAHLILAKAAFLSQESGEFECFDLPSTIDDFLRNNSPSEVE